jgi:hypothetical protein
VPVQPLVQQLVRVPLQEPGRQQFWAVNGRNMEDVKTKI